MGKIYTNENRILINEMIDIYKPDGFDWMSYPITKKNILTFHHILEIMNGGETKIENGALITKSAHRILNMLTSRDLMLYDEWQQLFKYINECRIPLDDYAKGYSRELKKHTQKVIYK